MEGGLTQDWGAWRVVRGRCHAVQEGSFLNSHIKTTRTPRHTTSKLRGSGEGAKCDVPDTRESETL